MMENGYFEELVRRGIQYFLREKYEFGQVKEMLLEFCGKKFYFSLTSGIENRVIFCIYFYKLEYFDEERSRGLLDYANRHVDLGSFYAEDRVLGYKNYTEIPDGVQGVSLVRIVYEILEKMHYNFTFILPAFGKTYLAANKSIEQIFGICKIAKKNSVDDRKLKIVYSNSDKGIFQKDLSLIDKLIKHPPLSSFIIPYTKINFRKHSINYSKYLPSSTKVELNEITSKDLLSYLPEISRHLESESLWIDPFYLFSHLHQNSNGSFFLLPADSLSEVLNITHSKDLSVDFSAHIYDYLRLSVSNAEFLSGHLIQDMNTLVEVDQDIGIIHTKEKYLHRFFIYKSISCRNLIKIKGISQSEDGATFVVTEDYQLGSFKARFVNFPETKAKEFTDCVIELAEFIESCSVQMIDYLCVSVDSLDYSKSVLKVVPSFSAIPEELKSPEEQSTVFNCRKSEFFRLGLVIFYIIFEEICYLSNNINPFSIVKQALFGHREDLVSRLKPHHKTLFEISKALLSEDPESRPDADTIKNILA